MNQYVYSLEEASSLSLALIGGKGAGLVEMRSRGLRVPPGLVITTDACREFLRTGQLPADLRTQVRAGLDALESKHGKRLGDPAAPLLLSVRSGAPISMPGMMDTVLDLGVSDATEVGLGDRTFARDAHRRFLESYGSVVLGVALTPEVVGLDVGDAGLVAAYRDRLADLPAEPFDQVMMAVEAVFRSWLSDRARAYRTINDISEDLGTAVVIQTMVFGNRDAESGTGVLFTRNPNNGVREPYGDFLLQAQGEDVVSGRHATRPIAEMEFVLPEVWAELMSTAGELERSIGDMLDIEFTIESRTLWFLQVRRGKRSAAASICIAMDMVAEGTLTVEEALLRVDPAQLERAELSAAGSMAESEVLASGLGASPGVVSGAICTDPDRIESALEAHGAAILVRAETTPEDVYAMSIATGILTTRGGLVSHAAVVARDMGVPTVVGAAGLTVVPESGEVRAGNAVLHDGDVVTIDGTSGDVVRGAIEVEAAAEMPGLREFLEWADQASGQSPSTAAKRLSAAHDALRAAATDVKEEV